MTEPVVGILLAAGAGTRLGRPKALVTDKAGRSWLARSTDALLDGGVEIVYVVLGAELDTARNEVPDGCIIVEAADWAEGMGASLRAGLHAVSLTPDVLRAALVMLVDTPGVGPEVVARLMTKSAPDVLARASYDGTPGHPVLLGREHWDGVRDSVYGDHGARIYLEAHEVELVECGDIGWGDDVDTAADLHDRR
ncbi:MAG: nucleotidyltransferase family protein [Nocardioidaceae bacterium]